MKKYWVVMKMSIARLLAYRFNFFLGRLRNIIVLLLFYYVWRDLTLKSGVFAGYSEAELVTYVFGANLLRSIIFGPQSRDIAEEINQGIFSKYLVMPINYFWFNFCRELGLRFVHLFSAVAEVAVFAFILQARLLPPADFKTAALAAASVFLAIGLYFTLSFLVNLLAFWSREAMGPRFLFEWFLEFASGAYFPLNILPKAFFSALSFLPFFYILYLPLSLYLGKLSSSEIGMGFSRQFGWIIVFGSLAYLTWQKGLKRYTGEGI
ncbi:MAG: ABC-2 family transporter protein [Planctomycetes bacterium]|jgi:ABC-2 type transport system permease protein|nr:ABC-2 family transporter protein [Planctomycetota bacterium]